MQDKDSRARVDVPRHARGASLALALALALELATAPASAQAKVDVRATPPAPAADVAAAVDPDATFFAQRLADARVDLDAGRHARASARYAALLADARFATLATETQALVLSLAASAAMNSADPAEAQALFARAVAAGSRNPDDWYWQAGMAMDTGDHGNAARLMTDFVEQWPELLDNLEPTMLPGLLHTLAPASPLRLSLLQALLDANWNRRGVGASESWFDLALLRLERGETDAARAAVRRVDSPAWIVTMRADRRFDAVFNRESPRADVARAMAQRIDRVRLHALSHPDRLDPQVRLASLLGMAGRHEEAVAVADAAIAAITAAPGGDPPFVDMEEQIWILDARSRAMRRRGRLDAALADLRRASTLGESGGDNVSQALNLATLYLQLGQPDDARAAAATAGEDLSGYGKMAKQRALHGAAVQRGDASAAGAALADLRAGRKEAPLLYLDALLDAERLDDAAHEMAAQLADPFERPRALDWAQDWRVADALPGEKRYRAARAALLQRQDVQAAVARVGRIETQPIFED